MVARAVMVSVVQQQQQQEEEEVVWLRAVVQVRVMRRCGARALRIGQSPRRTCSCSRNRLVGWLVGWLVVVVTCCSLVVVVVVVGGVAIVVGGGGVCV